MEKIRVGELTKRAVGRLLNPMHWRKIRSARQDKRRGDRAFEDPQLRLYSRILPQGFLHLGYFDDPSTDPERVGFRDIEDAQLRYAEKVLAHVVDRSSPVLDVGCGMGAMASLLKHRGFAVEALTPDRNQVAYIQKTQPELPVHAMRFEEVSVDDREGSFGTVLTSESLQYLDLDFALKAIPRLLKTKGRWIICDYLRLQKGKEAHRPTWDALHERLHDAGFEIISETDITSNVLPTVAYIEALARRFAVPIVEFVSDKLRTKEPGIFYLFEEALESMDNVLNENLKTVTPNVFLAQKSYRLVVLEKR